MKSKSKHWLPMVVIVACSVSETTLSAPFDFAGFDTLLSSHVKTTTIERIDLNGFDYGKLRASRADFDRIVKKLDAHQPDPAISRKHKLSFWINVYNIGAIKLVLDHPGISSMNDIGSKKGAVWKMDALQVGGTFYSLDAIEHQILRKLNEPRIHFAIVCASVSCPDIRTEAYQADKLEAQLDSQTHTFLTNQKKGMRIDRSAKKLVLTQLFSWFAVDFGGPEGVRKFVAAYASQGAAMDWMQYPLAYFDYNWKLNTL